MRLHVFKIHATQKREKNNSALHRATNRLNDDTLLCIVFVFVSLLFNAKRERDRSKALRWSSNRSLTSSKKILACFQSWFPGARLSLIP